jgi:hypothetical protein
MDTYLYKRKSDGKEFRINRSYDVFVEIINWYEGPRYEKEYILVTLEKEEKEEEVVTMKLLTDYTKIELTTC